MGFLFPLSSPLIYIQMQNGIKQQHVKVTLLSRITSFWFKSDRNIQLDKCFSIDVPIRSERAEDSQRTGETMTAYARCIREQVKAINNSYINTFDRFDWTFSFVFVQLSLFLSRSPRFAYIFAFWFVQIDQTWWFETTLISSSVDDDNKLVKNQMEKKTLFFVGCWLSPLSTQNLMSFRHYQELTKTLSNLDVVWDNVFGLRCDKNIWMVFGCVCVW